MSRRCIPRSLHSIPPSEGGAALRLQGSHSACTCFLLCVLDPKALRATLDKALSREITAGGLGAAIATCGRAAIALIVAPIASLSMSSPLSASSPVAASTPSAAAITAVADALCMARVRSLLL